MYDGIYSDCQSGRGGMGVNNKCPYVVAQRWWMFIGLTTRGTEKKL